MSKSKKNKKDKKRTNNSNYNLMELINNIDLEEVMSLLSGQGGNNVDDDYDEENPQMDLSSLIKNLGGINGTNKNLFNDPTVQLINTLKPIMENNRESIEKLLQIYFITKMISGR